MLKIMRDFHWLISNIWVSVTELNVEVAESAEQDQTARMCRLILIYTFREINLWSKAKG